MIITHTSKSDTLPYAYLNIFPDQFKTDKEKQDPAYIKNTMDYFANVAYAQYKKNKETFAKNYDLMKGIITNQDFYRDNDKQTQTIIDEMIKGHEEDLPNYVRHYPIINPQW